MEELNRREKWDREFEDSIPTNDTERAAKEQEYSEEMSLRRAWDERSLNDRLATTTGAGAATSMGTSISANKDNGKTKKGLTHWIHQGLIEFINYLGG
jgi:hypothetical protein